MAKINLSNHRTNLKKLKFVITFFTFYFEKLRREGFQIFLHKVKYNFENSHFRSSVLQFTIGKKILEIQGIK